MNCTCITGPTTRWARLTTNMANPGDRLYHVSDTGPPLRAAELVRLHGPRMVGEPASGTAPEDRSHRGRPEPSEDPAEPYALVCVGAARTRSWRVEIADGNGTEISRALELRTLTAATADRNPRPRLATLSAVRRATKGQRIAKVLRADPREPRWREPGTPPGIDITVDADLTTSGTTSIDPELEEVEAHLWPWRRLVECMEQRGGSNDSEETGSEWVILATEARRGWADTEQPPIERVDGTEATDAKDSFERLKEAVQRAWKTAEDELATAKANAIGGGAAIAHHWEWFCFGPPTPDDEVAGTAEGHRRLVMSGAISTEAGVGRNLRVTGHLGRRCQLHDAEALADRAEPDLLTALGGRA